MIAYGIGQIAEAIKNSGFNVFLLFYYNQVLDVSATGTSIALAVAMLFDAVTDPLVGSLSDKTKSRWGRRHPFILFAALPLAISFYFLFNPPSQMSELGYLLWLVTFAILVRTTMTLYYIPHLALGPELAPDYNQRSTMYAFNTFFGLMGGALFVPISYRMFFPTTEAFNPGLLNEAAYSPWSLFAGGLMISAIVLCFLGTSKEIPRLRSLSTPDRVKFSFKRLITELKDAFKNPSFRAIFFGLLLSTFILSIESVLNPFMGFHFWGMTTEQMSLVPLGSLTGLLVSISLIRLITERFDKKPILIVSALLAILNINIPIVLALMGVSWFPESGSNVLLAILILNAFFTACAGLMIFSTVNSMFADITDEHELEIGERREGIIFSSRAFALKATTSLGLIAGGILLDLISFPKGAVLGSVPADISWYLGFIAGPATSVFTFFGMILYMGYKIDRKRHEQIKEELREKYSQGR
jgi:Na+/melibiose symporter-like transporter